MDTDGAVILLQPGWTAANIIFLKSQIANFAWHSKIQLKLYLLCHDRAITPKTNNNYQWSCPNWGIKPVTALKAGQEQCEVEKYKRKKKEILKEKKKAENISPFYYDLQGNKSFFHFSLSQRQALLNWPAAIISAASCTTATLLDWLNVTRFCPVGKKKKHPAD